MNIQIVNEKDELIGFKPRGEVNSQADIYRAAGLWVTNSLGEVLIAQRKFTKANDPGKWGPAVAGTVEVGETYEANIYKEAEEEIGLTGVVFAVATKQRVTHPRNYFCQWYTATLDRDLADFVIQNEEVEQIKWISKEALIDDLQANPNAYTATMPKLLKQFTAKCEL